MTLEATRPDRLRRIAGWRSLRRAPDSIFPAWDSLLGLQTELFLPYELAFLLACPGGRRRSRFSVSAASCRRTDRSIFHSTKRASSWGVGEETAVIWPSRTFIDRAAPRGRPAKLVRRSQRRPELPSGSGERRTDRMHRNALQRRPGTSTLHSKTADLIIQLSTPAR